MGLLFLALGFHQRSNIGKMLGGEDEEEAHDLPTYTVKTAGRRVENR
jgi:hypothetical protein